MPHRILHARNYRVRVRNLSLLVVDKRDIDCYCLGANTAFMLACPIVIDMALR